MGLFGIRRPPRADDAVRRRIEDWAREVGGFARETTIKVNEIVCPDPACPGIETIILVMPPGAATCACKIAKPAAEVEREDVVHALRRDE